MDPRVVESNFDTLPKPVASSPEDPNRKDGDLEDQWDPDRNSAWAIVKGEAPDERKEGPVDLTYSVAAATGLQHPYLLIDVEYHSERYRDLRDDIRDAATKVWHEDAVGTGTDLIPIPVPAKFANGSNAVTSEAMRMELMVAQLNDQELGPIVQQKRREMDPHIGAKRVTGKPLKA